MKNEHPATATAHTADATTRERTSADRTAAARASQRFEVGDQVGYVGGAEQGGVAVPGAAAGAEAVGQRRRAAVVQERGAPGHVAQRRDLQGAAGADVDGGVVGEVLAG